MRTVSFSFIFLLIFITTSAQEGLNNYDSEGKRHGSWKITFKKDPGQVRYEGQFEHGKEIGLFKFYQLGQDNPAATKLFSPDSDTAEVTYYSQKGKIISEGKMQDTVRIGEWKYYHRNSDKLMMLENYENGVLHGEKLTYYENGKLAEKSFYKNGEPDGERILYSENGVILEHLTYEDGELHGPAKFYDAQGELLTEGNFKRDMHDGTWKYYENGELKEEKHF